MNVYDCVIFNGENDILEIRLNELNTYVDKFIIYEFAETFTGIKKKQQINFKLLDQFANKIDYQFVRKSLTENDPWKREGFQRNYISNSLNDAKPLNTMLNFIKQQEGVEGGSTVLIETLLLKCLKDGSILFQKSIRCIESTYVCMKYLCVYL